MARWPALTSDRAQEVVTHLTMAALVAYASSDSESEGGGAAAVPAPREDGAGPPRLSADARRALLLDLRGQTEEDAAREADEARERAARRKRRREAAARRDKRREAKRARVEAQEAKEREEEEARRQSRQGRSSLDVGGPVASLRVVSAPIAASKVEEDEHGEEEQGEEERNKEERQPAAPPGMRRKDSQEAPLPKPRTAAERMLQRDLERAGGGVIREVTMDQVLTKTEAEKELEARLAELGPQKGAAKVEGKFWDAQKGEMVSVSSASRTHRQRNQINALAAQAVATEASQRTAKAFADFRG